ncbi:hypothetical protein FGRMN_10682 [Fusarium graminum]|nr:hypothetical protein FGRMN_10682 [Fusarium graminum]
MAATLSRSPVRDISVRLNYLKRCEIYKAIRPYTLACKVDDEFPTNNLVFEQGPLEAVQDIRGLEPGQLTIEKNGFTMVRSDFRNPSPAPGSMDGDGGYLDEVRQLVRDALVKEGLKVDRVEIINYVFRTANKDRMFANADISGKDFRAFSPDTYVHNDCNFFGGDKRILAMLGAEADEILASNRVRLIKYED